MSNMRCVCLATMRRNEDEEHQQLNLLTTFLDDVKEKLQQKGDNHIRVSAAIAAQNKAFLVCSQVENDEE